MHIIPENLAFRLECKECKYEIDSDGYGIIECLVDISEHIEEFEHTRFELEIYDFDLKPIKETRDIVKIFEAIDDSLLLSDISDKLKTLNYENVDVIIHNAIKNDILNIDDIDNNEIYLALTDIGENLWEIIKK